MKYTIRQGRIAAIQHVTAEDDTRPRAAVYMGPENLAPQDKRAYAIQYDRAMPTEVQAVVDRNFRVLFSVPVEQREALVKTIQTQVVEA